MEPSCSAFLLPGILPQGVAQGPGRHVPKGMEGTVHGGQIAVSRGLGDLAGGPFRMGSDELQRVLIAGLLEEPVETDAVIVAELSGGLGCPDPESFGDLAHGQLRIRDVLLHIFPDGLDAFLPADPPEGLVLPVELQDQGPHVQPEFRFPLEFHGPVNDLAAPDVGRVHQSRPAEVFGEGEHKDLGVVVDGLHGGNAVPQDRVADLIGQGGGVRVRPGQLLAHGDGKLPVGAQIPDEGAVELFLRVQLQRRPGLSPEIKVLHGVMEVVEGAEDPRLPELQIADDDPQGRVRRRQTVLKGLRPRQERLRFRGGYGVVLLQPGETAQEIDLSSGGKAVP